MDENILYIVANLYFGGLDALPKGVDMREFFQKFQKEDKLKNLDPDFMLVTRSMFLVRAACGMLLHQVNFAKEWKPLAEKVVREYEKKNIKIN